MCSLRYWMGMSEMRGGRCGGDAVGGGKEWCAFGLKSGGGVEAITPGTGH